VDTYCLNISKSKPGLFVLCVVLLPVLMVSLVLVVSTGLPGWEVQLVFGSCTLPLAALLLLQLFLLKVGIVQDQLVVGGGIYKETIKLSAIRADRIKQISMPEASALMGARINGIGIPGFHLGWFQPYKGRKVLALVGESPVIWVPTSGEYDLLISVTERELFASELCRAAWPTQKE
jgi:hypothetical protein